MTGAVKEKRFNPFTPAHNKVKRPVGKRETLKGTLEHITFQSDEDNYTVARFLPQGKKQPVTIVGCLPGVHPGEVLTVHGTWDLNPKYGYQFKVESFTTELPSDASGIEKYLASTLIKGIGPIMASRIVKRFGRETLEVIENEPVRLLEVEGIGPKRLEVIKKAWEAQKEIKEVMLFLHFHGVSTTYAIKIWKKLGKNAIEVVQQNPYILAQEIRGIGFKTADKIAQSFGFHNEHPERIRAGILYTLNKLAEEGHTCYPRTSLIARAAEVLEASVSKIEDGLTSLLAEEALIETKEQVYLRPFYIAEKGTAELIKKLLKGPRLGIPSPSKAVAWVEKRLSINLTEEQKSAIKAGITEKVSVITGGPGVGKTTIINSIVQIAMAANKTVALAAPTGKAAKRMSETSGVEAKTIHRLLEFSPQKGFERNESYPIAADLVIIDEASMIDAALMYHLLKAIPRTASLILVGDADQLPSVGPGAVFKEVIASGIAPVIRLTQIFRQAAASKIIVNSHRVIEGKGILFPQKGEETDFFFIERENPEEILEAIVELVSKRIPGRFGFDPFTDIQVITPMNKGVIGTHNLNAVLQETLNPRTQSLTKGGRKFIIGDKVIQTENNYDKGVFNGDSGIVTYIDEENQELIVDFDGLQVPYDPSDLDEISLAYAFTIHKAQGSEFPCVVIPIHTTHYTMLQRNLLYTGMTRARKLLILVGSKRALNIAIRKKDQGRRHTLLREWLS